MLSRDATRPPAAPALDAARPRLVAALAAAPALAFALAVGPALARVPALLGDPRAGLAAALVMLLLAAGAGASWLSAAPRLDAGMRRRALVALALAAIATGALAVLPAPAFAAPPWARALAAAAVTAPAGFVLGLPLPALLRAAHKDVPRWLSLATALPLVLTGIGAALAIATVAVGVAALGAVLLALGIGGSVALAHGDRVRNTDPGNGLWRPPGHFYSPLPDVAQVRADAERVWPEGGRTLPGLELRLDAQRALLRELAALAADAQLAAAPGATNRYGTDNAFFGGGDAFVYHALLRKLRPRRVIEVGAGWSSALLLDTVERHLDGATRCTFVEPFPQTLHALLRAGDLERVRVLPQRVQDVPLPVFDELEANDVLFVDSSHVCKTGSDVHWLLFEVLPRLRKGVWVHFHDVGACFEYPPDWVYAGRAWNEVYALRALLTGSRDWVVELHAPSLAVAGVPELTAVPVLAAHPGGSLWLRRA
jgi:hypothetical protein